MESAYISNQNLNQPCSFELSSISYSELQLANPDLWNGQSNPVFIFGITETIHKDLKNIKTSLHCIADFIRNRSLKKKQEGRYFQSYRFQISGLVIHLIYL